MDDTISRLAVIQIIEKMRARIGHNLERSVGRAMIEILDEVGEDVGKLPSAEPTFDARDTQYNLPIGTDLISRAEAIDALLAWMGDPEDDRESAFDVLKQLPSAQPEPIYCKDCKHWIPYDWMFSEVWKSKNIADYPEDEIGCDCCDMAMKANDFCSRAERRTE